MWNKRICGRKSRKSEGVNNINYSKMLFNRDEKIIKIIEEKDKEIDKLTAESTELEERTYCWQNRAENLQIVLDKIKEFCNEQIKLANIEIDKCCKWRNADKEKYIITETNLSKANLIKKCNKRILRVMDLVENDKYYNAKQLYEEELLEEIE